MKSRFVARLLFDFSTVYKSKYRYLFVIGLAIYSYLNARFTVGDRLFEFDPGDGILILSITTIVLLLWEGNRFIASLLERRIFKVNHLLIQFGISVALVVIIALIVLSALYYLLGEPVRFNWANFKLSAAFAFRVNLFLNTVNAIVFYVNKSRKVELENEIQQKLLIESQHQNLKNQVNPHFLFNSLNVLASLVHKDQAKSELFIEELSKVYRYLLNHQEKELTSLSEELEFIESYKFLLETRFGEGFSVSTDIDSFYKSFLVAPGVLQILFENAVKHNVVSKQHPLKVSVSTIDQNLVVANNLQLKQDISSSTKIGLKNIINRYQYFTDKEVGILKTDQNFLVSLPLINDVK